MIKRLKKGPKSLFSRTLIAMLTISLTVLLLAAGGLFQWFQREVKKGYYQLTDTAVGNIDTSFSQMISDARSLTAELFSSVDCISLRIDPEADFVNHMSFVKKVQSLLNGTSYLQSFCVINSEKEISLYIASNVSHPDHLEDLLVDEIRQFGGKNTTFAWTLPRMYSSSGEVHLLTIPIADTLIDSDDFSGMAVLTIDLSQLQKSLLENNSYDSFSLMILDGNGKVISHRDASVIGQDWSQKTWVQKLLSGETGFQEKDGGENWEFVGRQARISGFYVVSQSEYITKVLNINYSLYVVLLVLLVAAITVILMILLVSRRIFSPFTSMVEDLRRSRLAADLQKNEEKPETAEQDDVEFLTSFYQGMSSRMNLLNQKKETDNLVKNLLLGNQQKEIRDFVYQKGILNGTRPYSMVLVMVGNQNSSQTYNMQEYDTARGLVEKIFDDSLQRCGHCTPLEISLKRLLFLVSRNPESENGIRDAVLDAAASVRKLSSVTCFCVGFEELRDEGENLCGSFGKLNDHLKTRQLLNAEEPLWISENRAEPDDVPDCEPILESIRGKNREEYHDLICREIDGCGILSFDDMFFRLEQIADAILRAGRVSRSGLHETLRNCSSKEELIFWFYSLYDETVLQVSRGSSHSAAAMMEDAVDYIRNHYDDTGLGVNLLAERLGISTAYFGKLFTEFTGQKTLDYLLKVRMEKAQELLLSAPEKSISQVAAEVGYSNSTYFTTAFRKYVGVTPSKFREIGSGGIPKGE